MNQNREDDEKYKKFQCKICLDLATEPVITPCGHLYCWQCLYNWAQSKTPLKCPYCSNVFELDKVTTIFTGDAKEGEQKHKIPKRPQNPRTEAQPQSNRFGNVQFGFGFGFPFMMFSTFNINQQGNARTFMIVFFVAVFLLNFLSFSDSYQYEAPPRQARRNNSHSSDFGTHFAIGMAMMACFAGLNYLARKVIRGQ